VEKEEYQPLEQILSKPSNPSVSTGWSSRGLCWGKI